VLRGFRYKETVNSFLLWMVGGFPDFGYLQLGSSAASLSMGPMATSIVGKTVGTLFPALKKGKFLLYNIYNWCTFWGLSGI